MHTVVNDITRDDEPDRRDVQNGRVVCVGVADLDRNQALAFQLQSVSGNRLVTTGLGGI